MFTSDTAKILDETPGIICKWLIEVASEQGFWDASDEELAQILHAAISAHFMTADRMQTERIQIGTMTGIVQQYFAERFDRPEVLAGLLAQEAPARHLMPTSLRRQRFLEFKRNLKHLQEGERAQLLAEIFYLMLAILEDRELKGSAAIM